MAAKRKSNVEKDLNVKRTLKNASIIIKFQDFKDLYVIGFFSSEKK